MKRNVSHRSVARLLNKNTSMSEIIKKTGVDKKTLKNEVKSRKQIKRRLGSRDIVMIRHMLLFHISENEDLKNAWDKVEKVFKFTRVTMTSRLKEEGHWDFVNKTVKRYEDD